MMTVGETVRRVNRATREAQLTKEQAIAWARDQNRWPERRFRVVAGGGGLKSRLLGQKAAERARARFGGIIEELIPPQSAVLPRQTKHARAARDLGPCPTCKARPDWPCVEPLAADAPATAKPKTRDPHEGRR